MKLKILLMMFIAFTWLNSTISCATEKVSLEQLETHTRHWYENKDNFLKLAKVVRSIQNNQISKIDIINNNGDQLELLLFPEHSIDEGIKKRIKELTLSTGIFKISITNIPYSIGFIGISSFIGDDYLTGISINSAYIFTQEEDFNLPKEAYCDKNNYPPKFIPRCYVKLADSWVMEHSIFIPKQD